jgi:hypothetical protein
VRLIGQDSAGASDKSAPSQRARSRDQARPAPSQILHHGTGLLLDGVRKFAGRIGLIGRRKNGVNRCVAIVRYRRMFEDIRRKMNIEATQNNRTNRRVEVVFR